MDNRKRSATAVARAKTAAPEDLADSIRAAVAEAVAEKEVREAEELARKPKPQSSTPVFFIVVLVAFIASALYAFLEIRSMSTPLEKELGVEADAAGVHLYSIAVRLEQFNKENHHYPSSLGLAGIPSDGSLDYTLLNNSSYRIEYKEDGVDRTYRSTQPPEILLGPRSHLQN
jgi:hypothetical protein